MPHSVARLVFFFTGGREAVRAVRSWSGGGGERDGGTEGRREGGGFSGFREPPERERTGGDQRSEIRDQMNKGEATSEEERRGEERKKGRKERRRRNERKGKGRDTD